MKKYILSIAISAVPVFALAGNNTINFKGEVANQTCSVSVNGIENNPTVLLPTVSAADLNIAGATAGLTNFTVGVTGCTPSGSTTSINTIFVGNQITASGNMANTGTASNVELQLVEPLAPENPINLSSGYSQSGLSLAAGATSAQHDFAVRYYASGVATAGSVMGSVQYSVTYQ